MNQLRYIRYHYRPRRRKRKLYLSIFLLLCIGGGVYYSIFYVDFYNIYSNFLVLYRNLFGDYGFLEKNLEAGNYNIVIHEGLPYLEKKPNNPRLLRYLGESYYYISSSLTEGEKEESINNAILYLRKGIALSRFGEVLTKSYFILGMSYFKKGTSYYELAVEYLKKALDDGYKDKGISELLGYCYYKLGAFDEAITYLEKAKDESPKDVTRLYLAHAYKDKGMYESALKELNFLIEGSEDPAIVEEAYAATIWIDFKEERFDNVRKNIESLLKINPGSAFAHYWLGNLYEREGNLLAARKEWRETLKIDPKHIGAIEKLY
jgi:tetratricopeptide (TPR) repeat protein